MAKRVAPVGTPEWQGDHWLVPSSDRSQDYEVKPAFGGRLPGFYECSCSDYWFRGRKGLSDCKHILAVKQQLIRETAEGDERPAEDTASRS
jgi:hypothetical protein